MIIDENIEFYNQEDINKVIQGATSGNNTKKFSNGSSNGNNHSRHQ